MRVLAGGVERVLVVGAVEVADRGARLHRVGDQPVVDELERRRPWRRRRRRRRRPRLVADEPVVAEVVRRRRRGPRRRPALERRAHVDDGGQHLVVHDDRLGGVARLRPVSAITTATGSPTWRTLPSASTGCVGSAIGEPSWLWICQPQGRPPSGGDVRAGEDRDHPRHRRGGGGVDRRMRPCAASGRRCGVGLAGAVDVVGVVAAAGQEAHVLLAPRAGADASNGAFMACLPVSLPGGRPLLDSCGRLRVAPSSAAAAPAIALTMLW